MSANFEYGRWLSSPPPGEEVVISGMAGRLPECNNVEDFQKNLFNKVEMVNGDGRRWKLDHPEIPQRTAKIPEIDKFDAGFFGLHHRQANSMEPMLRPIMETAVEAVMDAGVNPSELEGSKTGVFVSISWSDIENDILTNVSEEQKFVVTGFLRSMAARRVSYFLKLKGPSMIVDTACSSSMNGLAKAFQAMRSGYIDNALIGCGNLLLHPGTSIQFFRLGVLSKEGCCKVFDQNADGYVRGETAAFIFLQKSKNARRIYSQVVHVKVNSDGFKEQGITFPSFVSQQQLMTEVYEESGVHPNDLSFMEAHGTGTQVGDPQEVAAIDLALAQKRDKPLLIGSVKCTIGHTEPCSGICSIIKVIIAFETGLIAPNINLKKVKEGIEGLEQGRMKVVTELTELEGEDALVGINNFGFGGNNCHAILRRFPKTKINNLSKVDIPRLVCVSGRTEEAVLTILEDLKKQKFDLEYVGLLHHLFKMEIPTHLYRGYSIISEDGVIKTSSKFYSTQQSPLYFFFGSFENNYKILASYFLKFPIFEKTIKTINNILKEKHISDFETMLRSKNDHMLDILGSGLTQLGIVDVLKTINLEPTAVYGDSLGKVASAYFYDVISLQEATKMIVKLAECDFQLTPNITKFTENSQDTNKNFDITLTPKNAIILNISDSHLNNKDVLIVEQQVNFLDILGRLYEEGYNPHLDKLYPEISYPISRGTRMISPLIKWNHDQSWFIYKFIDFTMSDGEQQEISFSLMNDEHKFIAGHVIDGRNLFPATEYLNLVWGTYAQSRRSLKTDQTVLFENCKFIRAVTMPKSGFVKLLVSIQRGSGYFEVVERDSLVVSGWIRVGSDLTKGQIDLPMVDFDYQDPTQVLEKDEIYRDMYLRGYNYSDVFKGIVKCNSEVRTGLIKWEDNWCSFMDKMLQMSILQSDTRMLYVPVSIKKLIIDPQKHQKCIQNLDDPLVPVYVYKECNLVKAGGIEIKGLKAKSILKKRQRLQPVLEKHVFIPNDGSLSNTDAVRVDIQIILENSFETNFKAVEIIDDSKDLLLPLVSKALDDVPVVTPDLTISTKEVLEDIPGIKIEPVVLTPESKLLLIIGRKMLERPNFSQQYLSSLNPQGFILTREDLDYVVEKTESFEVLTEFTTPTEKLILLRKSERLPLTTIHVSSENFKWLPHLQNMIKNEPNILVYSQNQKYDGTLGLINCLRREPSGQKIKCFFIMDEAPDFDMRNPFYSNQIKKQLAINIFKDGKWGTYRHLLLEKPEEVMSDHYYANVTSRGDLSSFKWLQGPLREQTVLKENQVLLFPYYCAVNFKDVMVASGRVSVDAFTSDRMKQDCVIGLEISGRDPQGNRFIGMIPNRGLSNIVTANDDFVWKISDDWSFEDAATVPVVYSTVLLALTILKKITPGTSILIHSATGGIGLAALNVCLYHKCKIFVTVGTKEKREYLRRHYPQIPENHIASSRDTSFEEMIKKETNHQGVDMVLNSLSDDKLRASIRCLANGGSFLEIGKYDLDNDSSLNLLLMERGASYHGIMLDQILLNNPELKHKIRNVVQEGMDIGYIKPLPRLVFPKEELEQAFRHMTTGKHIGKVLIKIRDEEDKVKMPPKMIQAKAVPRFNCDSQKSYIIVGGLGGIGLELADWLVLRGATKLILVSRTGISNGYQTQRLRIWRSYGVHIQISTQNVTTKKGCEELIKEGKKLGPIDAIFNLAVVLKDALFEDQNEETFQASFEPKARATRYLDEITREKCPELGYFVIFSSVSCGRGNPGQSNYGMANSVMERICEKRKEDGFPAVAIQWGAIGDVGLVAKMQKENKELVIGGTLQQKISSCLEVLDTFLKQDNPVVSSMVVAEKYDRYGNLNAVDAVASVLGIKDIKSVSQHSTLTELGMDSMTGTEIIQLLEKDFEIYITAQEVRSMTLAKLKEMEEEKKLEKNDNDKMKEGAMKLIQYIPDQKNTNLEIVKLSSGIEDHEDGPTVFIFPGMEGVFTPWIPFVSNIKAHVFGVQYSYYCPEETIQEIAENILPHVEEKINKDKSLLIVGYSFGAVVGLEVARLLEEKNYTGKITVIDGSPAYLQSSIKQYLSTETEHEFETSLICKILEIILPIDIIEQSKNKLIHCTCLAERINLAKSLIPNDIQNKQKLDEQAALTLYKRVKAIANYKQNDRKIKSAVHLFKAKHPMVSEDEDYQLSKMCEHVSVTSMEGDHATILNQPGLVEGVTSFFF